MTYEYLVIGMDGTPVSLESSHAGAVEVALDSKGEMGVVIDEAVQELNTLRQNPERNTSSAAAIKQMGLGVVTMREIDKAVGGVENIDSPEAMKAIHKRLSPIMKQLQSVPGKGAIYDDPLRTIRSFIGGNEKTNKIRESFPGRIAGLSLAPFWSATYFIRRPMVDDGRPVLTKVKEDVQMTVDTSDQRPRIDGEPLENLCSGSSAACRMGCLVNVGNNATSYNMYRKIVLTHALYSDPVAFCAALIMAIRRYAKDRWHGTATSPPGLRPYIRANMVSDIPWEVFCPPLFELTRGYNPYHPEKQLAQYERDGHPPVNFYDYTKVDPLRRPEWKKLVRPDGEPRIDLTFSFSGENEKQVRRALDSGLCRAAVIFMPYGFVGSGIRKRISDKEMPETLWGHDVHGGNDDDFRALDPKPAVIGLSFKVPVLTGAENLEYIQGDSRMVVPVVQPEPGVFLAVFNGQTDADSPASDGLSYDVRDATAPDDAAPGQPLA